MQGEEENGWVFDSLVCFLNGPVWSAPLESFIEENSLIFEPTNTDNTEYKKIFNDYKNLVDFMLGNFMEDIGITPQQFENACARGTQGGITLQFDQTIFEQIWAANDFEMFRRMMTQRNVELQLQALELIEQKYGITPNVFVPEKRDVAQSSRSKTPEMIFPGKLEEEIMKEVAESFKKLENTQQETINDNLDFLEEKQILEEKLKTIEKSSPIQEKNLSEIDTKKEIESKAEESKTVSKPSVEVDSLEMKKRQEYLRAQRDKLVALKKEARKKHLQVEESVVETKQKIKERPKSAKKAAESVLDGHKVNLEPQELALRKALVQKLKNEVISKANN
nr:cilia- and flagella-associated protein 36 [Onthophagus taurus]XP_022914048.1 cilia- and flagella-associated protein 36 [Onthophagus taurus]